MQLKRKDNYQYNNRYKLLNNLKMSHSFKFVCYFEGTPVDSVIHFDSIEEFEKYKKEKWETHIIDELRKGISIELIKSQSLVTLQELHQEILNKYENKEFTLKNLKKLWKEDFPLKVTLWYMLVTCCIKLRVFEDDNMYGWLIINPEAMQLFRRAGMIVLADLGIKNRCSACDKEAFNKCSKCRTIYYCCQDCQNADWKNHKKTCC
jgi:hypothetical protein